MVEWYTVKLINWQGKNFVLANKRAFETDFNFSEKSVFVTDINIFSSISIVLFSFERDENEAKAVYTYKGKLPAFSFQKSAKVGKV